MDLEEGLAVAEEREEEAGLADPVGLRGLREDRQRGGSPGAAHWDGGDAGLRLDQGHFDSQQVVVVVGLLRPSCRDRPLRSHHKTTVVDIEYQLHPLICFTLTIVIAKTFYPSDPI